MKIYSEEKRFQALEGAIKEQAALLKGILLEMVLMRKIVRSGFSNSLAGDTIIKERFQKEVDS